MNITSFSWEDLKFFYSVAQHGTLSSAAAELGSSQPTVGRRIAALEEHLGVSLFRRDGRGYALTAIGARLLKPASEIEALSWEVQRQTCAEATSVRGQVRISTSEGIGVEWLVDRLSDFRLEYPNVAVSVVTESDVADINRLAADIAIRLFRPESPRLSAANVGGFENGLFVGEKYLSRRSKPKRIADLETCEWVTFDEDLGKLAEVRWLTARTAGRAPGLRSNDVLVQRAAAIAGLGVVMLPEYLGRDHDELVRVLPRAKLPSRRLWLVAHEDLAEAGCVRVLLDFLRDAFAADGENF